MRTQEYAKKMNMEMMMCCCMCNMTTANFCMRMRI